jgi:outer membrane protein assembly factor BamA
LTARSLLIRTALAATVALPVAAHAAQAPGPDAPLKLSLLSITGNSQVKTADLDAALPFHQGDTVTRNQITEGTNDLIGVYRKQNVGGHFGTKTTFLGNTVKVYYMITEDAPAAAPAKAQLVVDNVVVSGNKQVKTADIDAAIKLKPGAPVNEDAVRADMSAIQGVYKKANVGMSVVPDFAYPQPNHVVITYKITETN